jgi:pSer/pThr/pTyr-binding forkhead associated (FHA) protein
MSKSWTIGSRSDCDLVVNLPRVSGHHCRLTLDGNGYVLEDLESTNGTYVNGTRITDTVRITQSDSVTLGLTTFMPWPPDPAPPMSVFLRIGREPDNDLVVDVPTVSGHHARVIWEGKPGKALIEDLGSSNGTAVGSPDRKITREVISTTDTIYLGTHALHASQVLARCDPSLSLTLHGDPLLIGSDTSCDRIIDDPLVSARHARLARRGDRVVIEDLGSSNGTFVNGRRSEGVTEIKSGDLIGLGDYTLRLTVESLAVAPTPVVAGSENALAVDLGAHVPASDAGVRESTRGWDPIARQLVPALGHVLRPAGLAVVASLVAAGVVAASRANTAAVFFRLGLVAIALGLVNAVIADAFSPRRLRDAPGTATVARLVARFVVFGTLGVLQCILAWAVCARVAGLRAPWVEAVALLSLASAVGLAAGSLVVAVTPRTPVAWAVLGALMIALWVFGGERVPLAQSSKVERVLTGASPSRWAFEGLLLLEADREELAEHYFPGASERMGVPACALALAFMFVGLTAAAGFIAHERGRAS